MHTDVYSLIFFQMFCLFVYFVIKSIRHFKTNSLFLGFNVNLFCLLDKTCFDYTSCFKEQFLTYTGVRGILFLKLQLKIKCHSQDLLERRSVWTWFGHILLCLSLTLQKKVPHSHAQIKPQNNIQHSGMGRWSNHVKKKENLLWYI